MSKQNQYKILKERQQKEWNEFPMKFAFSNKQFEDAMKEWGLTTKDTDKIYKFGHGGFYLRTDSKKLMDLIDRHDEELKKEIENDKYGEGFIYDMFSYELANHEYCITYSLTDTFNALGLNDDDILNNSNLKNGLELATKKYHS